MRSCSCSSSCGPPRWRSATTAPARPPALPWRRAWPTSSGLWAARPPRRTSPGWRRARASSCAWCRPTGGSRRVARRPAPCAPGPPAARSRSTATSSARTAPPVGVVIDGRMLRTPDPHHEQLSLQPLRATTSGFGKAGWSGTIVREGSPTLPVHGVNVALQPDKLMLYTSAYGATTPPCQCAELVLRETGQPVGVLDRPGGTVLDHRASGQTPLHNGYVVLAGHGAAAQRLASLAGRGQPRRGPGHHDHPHHEAAGAAEPGRAPGAAAWRQAGADRQRRPDAARAGAAHRGRLGQAAATPSWSPSTAARTVAPAPRQLRPRTSSARWARRRASCSTAAAPARWPPPAGC